MTFAKRRICALLMLLAAGAVASVLFSWTVAVCSGPGYDAKYCTDVRTVRTGQPDISSLRIRTFGHEEWWRVIGDGWGGPQREDIKAPTWAPPPDPTSLLDRCTAAYGFPFLCLRSEFGMDQSGARWDRFSVTWGQSSHPVVLPLAPIWFGLLANTFLYAAIFFSIPWIFFVSRRLYRHFRGRPRRRRGHCPFCGYDLRGDFSRVCSECGRGGTGVGVDAVTGE